MKNFKNFIKDNYKDIIKDIAVIAIFFILLFVDFPYVIYKPGGVIDVSERIKIEGITPNEKGTYNLSYVSSVKANAINLAASYLIKDWERIKIEDVTYEGTDYEETFRIDKYMLKNAIDTAIIVAYKKADKEITIGNKKLVIAKLDEKADTTLKLVDEILEVDNEPIKDNTDLRNHINSKKVGEEVKLKVIRDEKEITCTAKVFEAEGKNVIGIYVLEDYYYTTNPKIEVEKKSSEAGSSGGFMTALAIYDSLIEEDLTHGKTIVGTGTIDGEGNVGEIGGVKYKLLGADKAGADIFFVPKDNYEEAKEVYDEYDLTFKLIKVNNIDDAIEYLNSIK